MATIDVPLVGGDFNGHLARVGLDSDNMPPPLITAGTTTDLADGTILHELSLYALQPGDGAARWQYVAGVK